MSDYKPITCELRKYAGIDRGVCYMDQDSFDRLCDSIDAIHAQLERENAMLRAARGDDWIKLPVDVDGLPIRIGDVMQMGGDSELRKVVGFYEEGFIAWLNGRLVPCDASFYCHHLPDTWERIIEDAVNVHGNGFNPLWTDERDALVARCKKLAGDAE